jgi:hypothetical protein
MHFETLSTTTKFANFARDYEIHWTLTIFGNVILVIISRKITFFVKTIVSYCGGNQAGNVL